MKLSKVLILSALTLYTCILGCEKISSDRELSLSESHQKIITICKEELNTDIVLKAFEHTVWIYVPLRESLFGFKADKQGPQSSKQATEKIGLEFLDVSYSKGNFLIEYDVSISRNYDKSYGYTSSFSDKFQRLQQNILTAINRAYFDVAIHPDDPSHKKLPDFVILIFADITRGIESRSIFHLQDLKRVFTDMTFQEEYSRRAIHQYPQGNTDMIGDTLGKSLDAHDMTWGEFLAKQIRHRIDFKYTRSAFAPSEDTAKEILTIISDAIHAYNFTDFENVKLHDLNSNKTSLFGHQSLKDLKPSSQKYKVIQFNQ